MNREIEFRGFDGTKWYYGDLEYNRKTDVARIHTYTEDGSYGRQYSVDPDTIGQFTGLRDKKGVKIFEGDILKAGNESAPLEVRFVRGVFAFLWNGNLDDEFPCNAPTYEWAEVVGNIYYHTKLLNEK